MLTYTIHCLVFAMCLQVLVVLNGNNLILSLSSAAEIKNPSYCLLDNVYYLYFAVQHYNNRALQQLLRTALLLTTTCSDRQPESGR